MCGIAGYIGDHAESRGLRAIGSLEHRGPDGQGSKAMRSHGRNVWFAHTRLAIQDLSPAGAQPMESRDGNWVITFNGEIYNHLRLRSQLTGPFRGHSDTETLIEGIAAHGVDGWVSKCEGIFAFAALDKTQGRLYLVRDPFGTKPLYYSESNTGLAFASEIRALSNLVGDEPAVDDQALKVFLTLRYVPSPMTLHRGFSRIPAGHLYHYDLRSGKGELSCYVQPTTDRFTGSFDQAVTSYESLLEKQVEDQLLSDVPVGVLLSGGIDSAVVAAMAKRAGRVVPCYSVGMGENHQECELESAAETARVLGLPHVQIRVSPQDLWNSSRDVFSTIEEPLGTTSTLLMWPLIARAKQDVTVLLSGQGSDEPWGGYTRYQAEVMRRWLPASVWQLLTPLRGVVGRKRETIERAVRALPVKDMACRFEEEYVLFDSVERRRLLGVDDDGGALDNIRYWLRWEKGEGRHPVERMMRIDTRLNLADDLLLYSDKVSMAHSLELRVPMLGLPLVRFIEALPLDFRVRFRRTKVVHKAMASRFLPQEIVHRPKRNFQLPFSTWSRTVWRDQLYECILGRESPLPGVLAFDGLKAIWESHQRGQDNSRKVFALWALSATLRQIGGKA